METPAFIECDRPLAPLTTWQIGGPARFYAEPGDPAELSRCLAFARENELPVLALGGASNMLVADRGFDGLVVRYMDASESLQYGPGHAQEPGRPATARLRAGARAFLSRVARSYARQGWSGLEWAEGIPGTIGGAVVGNAGAFGGDIASVVREIGVLHAGRELRTVSPGEASFAYRTSRWKDSDPLQAFVLHAVFELRAEGPAEVQERLRSIAERRRAHSPAGKSCGSVFQNPEGDFAGRLVQEAGLRGHAHGAARIAPEHGNYIVNTGGATASDVLALIELARESVLNRFGVILEPEVRLVGFTREERARIDAPPGAGRGSSSRD